MAKPKKRKKANDIVARFVRPTEAREAHNDFRSAGAAVRVVPVIETMLLTRKLTQAQFEALNYYRDQAHQAEDDCAESSVLDAERIMGGGGGGMGGTIPMRLLTTPAMCETARIERDLGPLRDIARAVAVDDISLTQWCIMRHGGRERYDSEGVFLAMVPVGEKLAMERAWLELRYAAGMIAR